MAEYPLRYSPQALKYLSDHANEINFVAGSLGVSPLAVAAGVAREQTLESDVYPYQLRRMVGNPIRQALVPTLPYFSDQHLRSIYDATNRLDPETLMYPGTSAVTHPMLFDVGPGNIKLRTAISLLDNYNAQYKSYDDFLNLGKYRENLPQFISDLRDPNSTLTANLAGLLASEATQFYQRHMTQTAWNYLTDDQKAAAITQYYVRGPEKLTQEANGQEFWLPDFSKPGSSFYNYKDNADVLRAALNYNTYPEERNSPQRETDSIESAGNTPYAYVSVPATPAIPKNALNLYGPQSRSAPAIENALIPRTTAGTPVNTLDPAMLATMALVRTFGLPPGTDIGTSSLAQR